MKSNRITPHVGLEPREPLPDSVTFSYHHVAYGTYDGMMLDTLKETLSLARVIACPFLMEEELPIITLKYIVTLMIDQVENEPLA